MLECAIPKCTCSEKFLRSGSLHLVDLIRPDGTVAKRMIWLCGECTSTYAVQTWRPAGEQIRLREASTGQMADVLQMPEPRLETTAGKSTNKHLAAAARRASIPVQLASAG